MAEDLPFRLRKELPGVNFIYTAAPTNTWAINPSPPAYPGNTWNMMTTGTAAQNSWYSEESIDISGISMQDLTLFFASNIIQRSAPYATTVTPDPTLGGGEIYDVVVVTDVPILNPESMAQLAPGFGATKEDFINVKLGIGQVFVQSNQTPTTMVNSDSFSFGSGDPTASDRLYIYRWVVLTAGVALNNNQFSIPSLRYIGTGISTKESDLVHINRMRLSYEQQQRV